MTMPIERLISIPDPFRAPTPDHAVAQLRGLPEHEKQWFDTGVFSVRHTSFPPSPSSKSPPIGDNMADDWFR